MVHRVWIVLRLQAKPSGVASVELYPGLVGLNTHDATTGGLLDQRRGDHRVSTSPNDVVVVIEVRTGLGGIGSLPYGMGLIEVQSGPFDLPNFTSGNEL